MIFDFESLKLKAKSGNTVFGLVIIALGLWALSVWWWSVTEFFRGFVPVLLILFGLVAIGAGISKKKNDNIEDN